eukprot:CAMPEP_0172814928 /NCGR_PEP_ID=MMETSP1075-20121228/11490_1 /TAXON_ID=2916 /ORGANISM="Ceratium fusus, Strain PA161109" /LENGTH=662 /DNA_ID=CAMNT_0013654749 /DNA_START=55 /DNA_END=2043 /DNA_ORIENTATION=+
MPPAIKSLRTHLVVQGRKVSFGSVSSVPTAFVALLPRIKQQDQTGGVCGYSLRTLALVGAGGIAGGILLEKKDASYRNLVMPSGFRTCCDVAMTDKQKGLPQKLEGIVGKKFVKCNADVQGSRLGRGTALALVKPGSMAEAVQVLEECVAADVVIIPQGANSGLTGASVPRNTKSDRPTVIINLRRLDKMIPINKGQQTLCYAGVGIFDLQEKLKKEFNRDSHSVLGSIFLNPTTAAGVAFGSGGTQIRKGPAYTDRALWCKVKENGSVEVVNTLGILDGGDPFTFLESKHVLTQEDVDQNCKSAASFPDYKEELVKLDGRVSRFNADTCGCDPNRSEGKVMILATIHDTYPIPAKEKVLWVSCKDLAMAHAIKHKVCLTSTKPMARSCEYFNRDIYEVTELGGRLCVKVIDVLGMKPIGFIWDIKRFVETLPIPCAKIIPEKFMWWFNNLFPHSLPTPLRKLGDAYDHHLLIVFSEYSPGEVDALQKLLDEFKGAASAGAMEYHVCEDAHTKARANLFRFVMAIAFKVYCTGKGMQGLAIDYALPKDHTTTPELPSKYPIAKRCTYSHFGCNVYHEDLVFGPDIDVEEAKHVIKHAIEEAGGKLPAEHGHGTEYHAPQETQKRWMAMDPLNVMNPGVGGTAYGKNYASIQNFASNGAVLVA